MRWVWFYRWLVDCKERNPDLALVAFEEVLSHGLAQLHTAHVYGGFKSMVEMFCARNSDTIALTSVGVTTIKKQWAGSGNADKKQMIQRCRDLGFKPADDNEADAIALLHIVCGTAPLLTPSLPAKRKKGPKDPSPLYRTTGPQPF